MAIRKKLTKLGNSAALIIDKSVLELLNIDSNTLLEISLGPDATSLIVRPIQDQDENRQRFEKAKREDIKRHGGAYKKLAGR